MKLSPLSLLLGTEILLWCVLGSAIHGWQILCYPLAWVFIGGFFLVANTQYDRRLATARASAMRANHRRATVEAAPLPRYSGLESTVSVN